MRVMKQMLGALVAVAGLVAVSAGILSFAPAGPATAQSGLTVRGFVPVLARDGIYTANSNLPQPDPSYCPATGNPPSPPNSILGLLTIGGAPAPAGTVVQIVLDGKVGPARFVAAPGGGYRLDYAVGGAGCPNRVGVSIGVLVNGVIVPTGKTVGSGGAGVPDRFDIAIP
jgi:hypothetical protein